MFSLATHAPVIELLLRVRGTGDLFCIGRRPAEQRACVFTARPQLIRVVTTKVHDAVAVTAKPLEIPLDLAAQLRKLQQQTIRKGRV